MSFLLSKKDGWKLIAANLKNVSRDGLDSVYAGLKELCEAKYLWKKQLGGKDGGGCLYLIFEEPEMEDPFQNPLRGFPEAAFPDSGNSHTITRVTRVTRDTLVKEEKEKSNTKKEKEEVEDEDDFVPELEDPIVNDNPNPSKAKNQKTKTKKKGVEPQGLFSEEEDFTGGVSAAEFMKAWNGTFSKIQKIGQMSSDRKKVLATRLKDPFWRDNWRKALKIVAASPWHNGENPNGWRAFFEWFMRPNTVTRMIEGKIDEEPEVEKPKKETIEDVRKKIDGGKFMTWLMKEIPSKYHEWDQFNCPETTIRDFLEQTA